MSYAYIYKLSRIPKMNDPFMPDEYKVYLEGDTSPILKLELLDVPSTEGWVIGTNAFVIKASYKQPITIRVYQNVDKPIITGAKSETKAFVWSIEYKAIEHKKEENAPPVNLPDPEKSKKEEERKRIMNMIIFLVAGVVVIVLSIYFVNFLRNRMLLKRKI